MSLKDFVSKIRAKHPEYNDIEDNELAQKVIQKYPQYQDMIETPVLSQPKTEIVNNIPETIKPALTGEVKKSKFGNYPVQTFSEDYLNSPEYQTRIQKNIEFAKQQGLDEGKTVDLTPEMYKFAGLSAVPLVGPAKWALPARMALQGGTVGLLDSGINALQGKETDVVGNVVGGTLTGGTIGAALPFLKKFATAAGKPITKGVEYLGNKVVQGAENLGDSFISKLSKKAGELKPLAEMPKANYAEAAILNSPDFKIHKTASEISNNIDPYWEMSDDSINTTGNRVYKAIKNHLKSNTSFPSADELRITQDKHNQIISKLNETSREISTPYGDKILKTGNEVSQIDFKPFNKEIPNIAKNTVKGLSKNDIKNILDETGNHPYDDFYYHISDRKQIGKIPAFQSGKLNEPVVWMSEKVLGNHGQGHVYAIPKELVKENLGQSPNRFIVHSGDLPLEKTLYLGKTNGVDPFDVYNAFQNAEHPIGGQENVPLNNEVITTPQGNKQLNIGIQENQPNEFVHEHGINLKNDTTIAGNQKESINDIRQASSGFKNSQVVKINQLSDKIRNLIPDPIQRQGLTLLRDVGGDVSKLKATDGDWRFEPYKPAIDSAIDMAENPAKYSHVQEANTLLEKYYNETGKAGLSEGFLKDLRSNYINRVYERQSPATGKAIATIDRVNGHIKQRNFETIIDAIDNFQKPATLDSADLLSIHGAEFSKTLANNKLVTALEEAGLGDWTGSKGAFVGDKQLANIERNIPQTQRTGIEVKQNPVYSDANPNQVVSTKQAITEIKEPIFDKNGNQIVNREIFAVPDWLEKGLKSISEPNFLNKVDELRAIHKYQGFVKTIDLSMSFFHHFTFVMQSLYQNKFSFGTVKDIGSIVKNVDGLLEHPEFNKMEVDFTENGGITSKVDQNIDVLRKLSVDNDFLQKALDTPGLKQFLHLNEKNANFLFGKMQRWLKVTDYNKKVTQYMQKNNWKSDAQLIDAKRSIAREVNAAYGGLNWEALGVSPSIKRIGQLFLLAPDWTYSNIELAKIAVQKTQGGTIARQHYTTALLGAGILTEGLSYLFTGHFTDKNPKGYEFEIEVRPGVYVSLFRGAIGDAMKLGSRVQENGVSGVGEFVGGKGSPFLRGLMTAATGRNYFGQKVTNTGGDIINFGKGKNLNFLQKSGNYISGVGDSVSPMPFGAKSGIKLIKEGNKDLANYMLIMAGAGRSGKKKEKPTVDYKRIMGIK